MVELKIKYNRHKNPLVFDIAIPQTWEELNTSNILYIGKFWQSWQLMIKDQLSMNKAKALLFMELTNIKSVSKQRHLFEALSLNESEYNVLALTDFIFNDFKLTKNLLPEIKIDMFTRFVGPSDKLSDITIEEFAFAFSCYSSFHSSNQEQWLNRLAAVLYRPKNPNYDTTGEIKIPFNNKLIPVYEKVFSKGDESYKNAIYLFFKGCLDFIAKRYPIIFQSQNQGDGKGSFNKTIVLMSGAEFGSYDETKRQNLYVFLDRLQDVMIEQAKNNKA